MADKEKGRKIQAKLHKGMPQVELTDGDNEAIQFELDKNVADRIAGESVEGPISISLESLDVDLQHNQSFGMVAASTGCISNPGGPSC